MSSGKGTQTAVVGGIYLVKANNTTGQVFVGNIKTQEIRSHYINDGRSDNPFQDAIDEAIEKRKERGFSCPTVERC